MCQKPSAPQARQRDGAGRPCARGWRPRPGGFRVKTAPVVSATGALLVPSVDVPCEADGRKLRVTVLHPWHGTG